MIIAVDFDGTIVKNAYPNIGDPYPLAIEVLTRLQKQGYIIILWTNRTKHHLDAALRFLALYDFVPDYTNENVPEIIEAFGGDTRKIYADVYIDDRNIFFKKPDWAMIYRFILINFTLS